MTCVFPFYSFLDLPPKNNNHFSIFSPPLFWTPFLNKYSPIVSHIHNQLFSLIECVCSEEVEWPLSVTRIDAVYASAHQNKIVVCLVDHRSPSLSSWKIPCCWKTVDVSVTSWYHIEFFYHQNILIINFCTFVLISGVSCFHFFKSFVIIFTTC